MQGKHLFLRCKDAQNNAGTWTAAITPGLLSQSEVRDLIEPRCNINEQFARACMTSPAPNSILRVYHPGPEFTVVTRSTWETDRLTGDGRKGAYSVSRLLTGEDAEQFTRQYAGAFDAAQFEPYDTLVHRAMNNYGRVTLGEAGDIFQNGAWEPSFQVFDQVGITPETFLWLMEGVYAALQKNSHFAVFLPKNLRDRWEREGDDQTTELLIKAVMALLPPETRSIFGFASHWNSQLDDRMVDGMHLVFVQAEPSQVYNELRQNSVGILDLASGQKAGLSKQEAPTYFRFLWEHLSDYRAIEKFWAFGAEHYGKVLRSLADTAGALECIFMLYQYDLQPNQSGAFKKQLFLTAARYFAGAGKMVPSIETFFRESMADMLKAPAVDAEVEQAVLDIMTGDRKPTDHQLAEYRLLTRQILTGNAQPETIQGMAAEPLRESRMADEPFAELLLELQPGDDRVDRESLFTFLVELFRQAAPERKNHRELYESLLDLLSRSLQGAEDYPPAERKLLFSTIRQYLSQDGGSLELNQQIYQLLFRQELAGGEREESVRRLLLAEEKRMFEANGAGENPLLTVFANCFYANAPFISNLDEAQAMRLYPRVYRLMCFGDETTFKRSAQFYRDELQAIALADETYALAGRFFRVQEESLQECADTAPSMQYSNLDAALAGIERVNLKLIPKYYPQIGGPRMELILRVLGNTAPLKGLLYRYMNNMHPGEQRAFCENYRTQVPLEGIYATAVFKNNERMVTGLKLYLPRDRRLILQRILEYKLPKESEEKQPYVVNFAEWYYRDVVTNLNLLPGEENTGAARLMALGKEAELLLSFDSTNVDPQLLAAAKKELRRVGDDLAQRMDGGEFVCRTPEEVRQANQICRTIFGNAQTKCTMGLNLLQAVDNCHNGGVANDPNYIASLEQIAAGLDRICMNYYHRAGDRLICARLDQWAKISLKIPGNEAYRLDYVYATALLNRNPETFMREYAEKDTGYVALEPVEKAEVLLRILRTLCRTPGPFSQKYIVGTLERAFSLLVRADASIVDNKSFQMDYFSELARSRRYFYQLAQIGGGTQKRGKRGGLFNAMESGSPMGQQSRWEERGVDPGGEALALPGFGKLCLICIPIAFGVSLLVFALLMLLTAKVSFWAAMPVGVVLLAAAAVVDWLEYRGLIHRNDGQSKAAPQTWSPSPEQTGPQQMNPEQTEPEKINLADLERYVGEEMTQETAPESQPPVWQQTEDGPFEDRWDPRVPSGVEWTPEAPSGNGWNADPLPETNWNAAVPTVDEGPGEGPAENGWPEKGMPEAGAERSGGYENENP